MMAMMRGNDVQLVTSKRRARILEKEGAVSASEEISSLGETPPRACTKCARITEKGELVTSWCIAARASRPPSLLLLLLPPSKWGNTTHVRVRGQDKKSFGDQGIFSFEQTD
jgi:hypothetical protein